MSKKKTAILFAYNGSKFNGSQIQNAHEGVRTVEAELQTALFKSRCISAENFGFLNKVKWSRASRTDKGVHALCAVVGLKMLWETKPCGEIIEEINRNLPDDLRVISLKIVANHFNAKNCSSYREYQYLFPLNVVKGNEETIVKMNEILAYFQGTHSFHNYSRDIQADSPEGKRYIVKFEVQKNVVSFEGCSYMKFVVTGQSFLYHQIRKMVGMSILVYLGKFTTEDIRKSFESAEFSVPLAPAEGLSLSRVHFTTYNKKQNHRPVVVSEEEEKMIEEFYLSKILPTIHGSLEIFQGWVLQETGQLEDSNKKEIEGL